MSKAILVATYSGREAWLKDCLESLGGYTRYPIITVNLPFEMGAITWAYDHTDLDEFLLLQDSVIVKKYDWIDELFDMEGSVSLSHHHYFMYMGKYTRKDLSFVSFPVITTKREAVKHEDEWTAKYAPEATKLWALHDTDVFEDRHGRQNMVIENEHLIKYKGTWHPAMIID